jgi:cytochrome c-type biogenesis protein CcmE
VAEASLPAAAHHPAGSPPDYPAGRPGRAPLLPAKFLVGGAILLLAVAYLVYLSLSSATVYYYTVAEVQAQRQALGSRLVRVSGTVAPGSIARDEARLRFDVSDVSDAAGRLPVVYGGIVPDIFSEEVEVVVEGRYGEDGVFRATSLLTKCPSRFEAALEGRREGRTHDERA